MSGQHPVIENLWAIETAPKQKRVLAVMWAEHDIATCDGNHLSVDTTGWLWCPVSGCTVQFDPEAKCPDHGQRGGRMSGDVYEGISYPVTLRATPGRDAGGFAYSGVVMWSADLELGDDTSLTASGSDPLGALAALEGVIHQHTVRAESGSGEREG